MQGSGFWVWGRPGAERSRSPCARGVRVQVLDHEHHGDGISLRVQGTGVRVRGLGFKPVQELSCRGLRVHGFQSSRVGVQDLGCRV